MQVPVTEDESILNKFGLKVKKFRNYRAFYASKERVDNNTLRYYS